MEGDIHPNPNIDIPFLASFNIIYIIFNLECHGKPDVLRPTDRTMLSIARKWIYPKNIRSVLSNAAELILISLSYFLIVILKIYIPRADFRGKM